jgi:hypothetical protein
MDFLRDAGRRLDASVEIANDEFDLLWQPGVERIPSSTSSPTFSVSAASRMDKSCRTEERRVGSCRRRTVTSERKLQRLR